MAYIDKVNFKGTVYDLQDSNLKEDISENTRNLCDVSAFNKGNVTVSDGVVTGTAGAFNSAFSSTGVPLDLNFEASTQYTFSFYAKNDTGGTGNGLVFGFKYDDSTTSAGTIPNSQTTYTKVSSTSTEGKTVSAVYFGYVSQGGYVWHLKDVQIEKGTSATEYIPQISATDYVNREQTDTNTNEISTINSTVSVITEQIDDYNALNRFESSLSHTSSDLTVTGGDGQITVDGTLSASDYFDLMSVVDMTTTNIEAGEDYYFDTGLRSLAYDGKIVIYFNVGNGLTKYYDNVAGVQKISIPEACTGFIFRFYPVVGTVFSNKTIRMTISKNKPSYLLDNYAEFRFLRAFGTGDSTIIKFANGETLVIDFGLNEIQGTLQSSWSTAVAELEITHIDYAIISHFHSDHVGMLEYGISSLLDSDTIFFLPNQGAFTQTELDALAWVDSMANDTIVTSYNMAMNAINTSGCKKHYPLENEIWHIGGAEVQFWNTDHSTYMAEFENQTAYDYNPCSLCNYITIGAERVCFSGDINPAVMTAYQTSVLPSQIFKVNHHSYGYAVVNMFLNSLMPEVDITMLGYHLSIASLGANANQAWCEANFVPNVVTGVNEKTLILMVTDNGYSWQNSVRKLIRADEGWT